VQLIYIANYTTIWAVVYFSVGLAFALSILVLNMLGIKLRAHLHRYRTDRFREEEIFSNVQPLMKQQKDWLARERHHKENEQYVHNKVGLTETEGKSREREIIGYTDFFFVLEDFSGDPIKQGSRVRKHL
jgi:ABC-type transport system involved in cytochrome bd biosynthesis fused ATPase/permease subunit